MSHCQLLPSRFRNFTLSVACLLACASATDASEGFAAENGITPGDYRQFVIDFDKPSSERYSEIFEYFKPTLLEMEDYWWKYFYSDTIKQWFADNIEELKEVQPEAYEFSLALAEFLDLDVVQTFAVSSISETSTYCTSIVARNLENQISHVRNLDFGNTQVMKQLVFQAILVKDGVEKARSAQIGGFYGAYTGQKSGAFSLSYNVRERQVGSISSVIMENLERNLDPLRITSSAAMLDVLLNVDLFDEVVQILSTQKMTSPSHFIIGGISGNEGIVISRNEDTTDHTYVLSEDNWFVAMTNVDVWEVTDHRYESAVGFMYELGQDKVKPDGQSIIEEVLWRDGVIQTDSIFTAAISAHEFTVFEIYDSPSYSLWPENQVDIFALDQASLDSTFLQQ